MTFDAAHRRVGDLAVVDLRGNLDGEADAAFTDILTAATAGGPPRLLLNLGDVSYINSTGIALLVSALADARAAGRTVLACGLTDHYREIFEITRIAEFMTIVDDEEAALREVGTP